MTLRERVGALSPAALDIFRKQLPQRLKELGELERNTALEQLQRLPELQLGEFQPTQQVQQIAPLGQPSQETPLWQKSLEVFGAPFQWVQESVIDPTLAALFSGVTPSVPGTENLPWWQRERAEFEAWKAPGFTLPWTSPFTGEEARIDIKGLAQTLPWFAIPGAGAVGRAGLAGRGIAGALGKVAPRLGEAAPLLRVAGRVIEYSPWGLAEKGLGAAGKLGARGLGKVAEPLTKRLGERVTRGIETIEDPLTRKLVLAIRATKPARVEFTGAKAIELRKRVASASEQLEKAAGEGHEAFLKAKGKLKGQLAEYPELEPLITEFTSAETTAIFEKIRTSPTQFFQRLDADNALWNLFVGGKVPTIREINLIESVLGSEVAKALMTTRPLSQQVWRGFLDVMGIPKSILSSYDLSAPFRQGIVLVSRHPVMASRNIKDMVRAFFSERIAVELEVEMLARPIFQRAQDALLYTAPYKKLVAGLASREEAFMTSLGQKIPILGRGIKASERAYVTFLNRTRLDTFEFYINRWTSQGVKFTVVEEKQLAKMINIFSGRGELGKLSEMRDVLNAAFFSPGFVASRIQTPLLLFTGSPLVRKVAAQEIASFVGAGMGILSLATLAGAKVEMDARSTDFGKIRVGNTRIDFWGGYQPYARFVAQMMTGERLSADGKVYPIDREDLVMRMIRSKESPVVGLLNDILVGETFIGEELTTAPEDIIQQARNRLVPMFAQDLWDAVEEQGLFGGFLALPGVLGATIVSYGREEKDIRAARDRISQERFGMDWDTLGFEMGTAAQRMLEQENPELTKSWITPDDILLGKGEAWREYRRRSTHIQDFTHNDLILASRKFDKDRDGVSFRERVNEIFANQRAMYRELKEDPQFAHIEDTFSEPLSQEEMAKMNPLDVARRAYNTMMYTPDLYDEYGEYRFDEVARRKTEFLRTYGQEALDYIETYLGAKWEEPSALQALGQARKILQPYWDIERQVWRQLPQGLKQISDQIKVMERTNPLQAKQILFGYPQIVLARRQIALLKRQLKLSSPEIANAYNMFYRF